ncbi:MAG: DUF2244 domain-containing protein [Paracoccaceae bacterium]|jgi:uncharacterized membrane protein
MPYRWTTTETGPVRLEAWPFRSLPRRGFVAFIAATALFLALPLLAVLGQMALWALLPFFLGTLWAIWRALAASYRSGEVLERLEITPERITLTRQAPGQPPRDWQANPHWVRPELHPTGGPVPDYLTLAGGPRPVELGAFLSPAERRQLHGELVTQLQQARRT